MEEHECYGACITCGRYLTFDDRYRAALCELAIRGTYRDKIKGESWFDDLLGHHGIDPATLDARYARRTT